MCKVLSLMYLLQNLILQVYFMITKIINKSITPQELSKLSKVSLTYPHIKIKDKSIIWDKFNLIKLVIKMLGLWIPIKLDLQCQ